MKNIFTPIFSCVIFMFAGINTLSANVFQNNTDDKNFKTISAVLDSIPPDSTGMRSITSIELAKELVPGWNVGNSLDAIGTETSWGNPKINEALISAIKDAGFKSVRIPVAWSNGIDTSTFKISTTLLYRVEEVINYVLQSGMYAIINLHWDGGWMNHPTYDRQEYINRRLAAMWQQIAVHFRDYDDHLLFAGTNEVMYESDYGSPKTEYHTVQNSFNQTFVNTVRSTGGCNAFRHLVVQGFNTNINFTINFFKIPSDIIQNRLMVEVHYYDPYNFTLNTGSSITQWGKNATDPSKTETWANESYVDAQFNKMKTNFIDKGYAVILGEYGVINRLNLGSDALNAEFAGYRRYYINYVTNSMFRHGIVPVIWDNGSTVNNGFGLFNRLTGEQTDPEIIEAIMEAVDPATGIETPQLNIKPNDFYLIQNYPNPFNPSTTISFNIPSAKHIKLKIYDMLGKETAILINDFVEAGIHEVKFNAENLPSGMYICQLNADGILLSKKITLMK